MTRLFTLYSFSVSSWDDVPGVHVTIRALGYAFLNSKNSMWISFVERKRQNLFAARQRTSRFGDTSFKAFIRQFLKENEFRWKWFSRENWSEKKPEEVPERSEAPIVVEPSPWFSGVGSDRLFVLRDSSKTKKLPMKQTRKYLFFFLFSSKEFRWNLFSNEPFGDREKNL